MTAGFAGLVQTHLLTCELVGVFTVLLCILLWKRLFRKETFLVLAKAALFSALLSAWFLVPFLDYMLRGDFVIQHVAGRTIQSRGLYLSHHLMTFLHRGGNGFFDATGLKGSDPAGIGAALLAVLLAWVYFRSRGKLREALDAQEMAFGKVCAWLGGFAILASCAIFPWDRIQSLGGIVQTLVSSLQFPHRFLIIATVLLAALAGTVAKGLWKKGEKAWLAGYCGGLAVLVLCSSVFLLDDILYQSEPLRVYGSNGLGTGYVAGGEYLPYGTDASLFTYHDPIANGVTVQGYRRDLGAMEMDCENAGSQEGTVELALLYYQGYRAYDTDTGEMIPILDGLNHSVTLVVPAGYQGHVRVAFHSPWHWRVAELVSVAAFVLLLLTRGGLPRKKGLLRKSS